MNTITCDKCGKIIEVDKALEGQIETRVLAAERQKHQKEMDVLVLKQEKLRENESKKAVERASRQFEEERKLLEMQVASEVEFARKKFEHTIQQQQKLSQHENATKIKDLSLEAAQSKQESQKLRNDLSKLMDQLRESNRAKDNAELEAKKKLAVEEQRIRQDAEKIATERAYMKQLELEKKLADTQKSLEDANRKATQGSQQNQGEVLELELERQLSAEFPADGIQEVKKGARGADIKQEVRTETLQAAGLLLWETKNGKWQPSWVSKFKNDIREASANIGVIVSQEMPREFGDMANLEKNVWVVKPRLAVVLAAALRATILQVYTMSRMNVSKDTKMEALFGFISGPEFKHRVEAIVENYGMLQAEIEKEKRASALRWSHQEKAIRAVIDNTIGMYGDLQGITNRSLPTIRSLELDG